MKWRFLTASYVEAVGLEPFTVDLEGYVWPVSHADRIDPLPYVRVERRGEWPHEYPVRITKAVEFDGTRYMQDGEHGWAA